MAHQQMDTKHNRFVCLFNTQCGIEFAVDLITNRKQNTNVPISFGIDLSLVLLCIFFFHILKNTWPRYFWYFLPRPLQSVWSIYTKLLEWGRKNKLHRSTITSKDTTINDRMLQMLGQYGQSIGDFI